MPAATHPELLYVANGLDGTVTRLDVRSGRPAGPPLPAGPAPWQLVVGTGGALLVLSAGAPRMRSLVHVAPRGGVWAARPVPLEPGAVPALLAGDGGRDAYGFDGGSGALRCIDLATGATSPAIRLPGLGVGGLAVTADRVYIPDAHGDRLWVADRRGRVLRAIPVRPRPLGVAVASGGRAYAPR